MANRNTNSFADDVGGFIDDLSTMLFKTLNSVNDYLERAKKNEESQTNDSDDEADYSDVVNAAYEYAKGGLEALRDVALMSVDDDADEDVDVSEITVYNREVFDRLDEEDDTEVLIGYIGDIDNIDDKLITVACTDKSLPTEKILTLMLVAIARLTANYVCDDKDGENSDGVKNKIIEAYEKTLVDLLKKNRSDF